MDIERTGGFATCDTGPERCDCDLAWRSDKARDVRQDGRAEATTSVIL